MVILAYEKFGDAHLHLLHMESRQIPTVIIAWKVWRILNVIFAYEKTGDILLQL